LLVENGDFDPASFANAAPIERRSNASRIDQLDALRGVAALSVVLYHMCCSVPLLNGYLACSLADVVTGRKSCLPEGLLLSATPLRTFVGGSEAVILFFVLSGFVLSLPFLNGRGPRYRDYVILRVCRIYIPAAISICIVACIVATLRPSAVSESSWVSTFWQHPVEAGGLLANLVLLDGALDVRPLNIVMWSLVQELRISLVLPFIVALMMRFRPGIFLAPATIVATIGYFGMKEAIVPWPIARSIAQTAFFTLAFVVGIETCRAWVEGRIRALLSKRSIVGIAALTALLLYNSMIVRPNFLLWYLLVTCASAIVIFLCASTATPRSQIIWRVIKWLGRVSYSLYLTHIIVLLTLIHALRDLLPYDLLVSAVLPLSLIVAGVYWRLIEHPSQSFGKWLVRRTGSKPSPDRLSGTTVPRDIRAAAIQSPADNVIDRTAACVSGREREPLRP
jgi:peptidoglycan/LPS O-acetylase OafA/YrhL